MEIVGIGVVEDISCFYDFPCCLHVDESLNMQLFFFRILKQNPFLSLGPPSIHN